MVGKKNVPIDATDVDYESIQESNFYYLFGVQEMDFSACLDIDTGKVTLFAPKVSSIDRIFKSPPRKRDIEAKYGHATVYETKRGEFIKKLKPVI